MLTLPPSVRLYVCTTPMDMRKSFDGLANATRHILREDPLSGHLFIYFSRDRRLCKALWWDGSGFSLYARRLCRGRFRLPARRAGASHAEVELAELVCILEGIDLSTARRRPRWKPPQKVLAGETGV